MNIMKIITFLLVSSIALCFLVVQVHSFASPFMGVGALFFKPKGMTIQSLDDLEKRDAAILEAGRFFVDAFWAGKGGNKVVFSPKKRKSLESQQMAEFRRRYLMRSSKTQSDLIVAKSGDGEIMGCAGIEVNLIKSPNSMSDSITAPLMSNVAVGRNFRRRGIAEDLIKETENIVSAWGYEVERQNKAAVNLYSKSGYRKMWEDGTATTLIPVQSVCTCGEIKSLEAF